MICSALGRFFMVNPFRHNRPAGFSHILRISLREGGQKQPVIVQCLTMLHPATTL